MDKELKNLIPEELEIINGGLVVAVRDYGGYVVDDNTGEILLSSTRILEAVALALENNINSHVISADEYQQRFGRSIYDSI